MLTVSQITKVAIQELTIRGCEVWRQNNVTSQRGRTFVGRLGVPDIIGFVKATGIFVGCEVKAFGDKLSPEQFELLMALKKAGGIALLGMEDARTSQVILVDPEEAVRLRPSLLKGTKKDKPTL